MVSNINKLLTQSKIIAIEPVLLKVQQLLQPNTLDNERKFLLGLNQTIEIKKINEKQLYKELQNGLASLLICEV